MIRLTFILALVFFCNRTLAISHINADTVICEGTPSYFTDSTPGGTWSSSNISVAIIDSNTGLFESVGAGTVTITYSLGGAYATKAVTVLPPPAPISGSETICPGQSESLHDSTGGGRWVVSPAFLIDAMTPDSVVITEGLTGATIGTVGFIDSVGCAIYLDMFIIPIPPSITGETTINAGSATTLSDPWLGGYWTSGDKFVATIDTLTGVVTGIAAGTSIITYSDGCPTTTTLTVLKQSAVGNIATPHPMEIMVYPNPASTGLTITAADKIKQINISDVLGHTVFSHQYSTEQVYIDVVRMPPGMYFIRINGMETREFVKE